MEETIHVHLVGQDAVFSTMIAGVLGQGFEVRVEPDFDPAALQAQSEHIHITLLDLHSAKPEIVQQRLKQIREYSQSEENPPVVVMLAAYDREATLGAIENGAYDTVAHPPDIVELRLTLRRAHKYRQAQQALYNAEKKGRSAAHLRDIIGGSNSIQEVIALAEKIAPCDVSVLITGETGTGKELLARAIHRLSSRAAGGFVGFSAANLPDTLVEDELFGHEKGAFTGAFAARLGRFEFAHRGTMFLDEIGDISLSLQPKLLRVLQEKSFERLGSNTSTAVDVRMIFATNRNLEEMVKQGKFREDLFYRVNVVQLHLPPLRERRDDIPLLAKYFLDRYASEHRKQVTRFSQVALRTLEEYDWPGNVRQLQNVIQRAVVLANSRTIEAWGLPKMMRNDAILEFENDLSYEDEVREFKRRLIVRTLRECDWKKSQTARRLRVARGYLHRLISQLEIRRDDDVLSPKELSAKLPVPEQIM